jgi:ferredoxin
MAYRITDYCTACGECLPICPNDAITGSGTRLRINEYLCTECVGFAAESQCAILCPAKAIVPTVAAALRNRSEILP